MRVHREKIVIPENHQVVLTVPDGFPSGPAEVIFLADEEPKLVALAGVLADGIAADVDGDPVRDVLTEMREERHRRTAEPF